MKFDEQYETNVPGASSMTTTWFYDASCLEFPGVITTTSRDVNGANLYRRKQSLVDQQINYVLRSCVSSDIWTYLSGGGFGV